MQFTKPPKHCLPWYFTTWRPPVSLQIHQPKVMEFKGHFFPIVEGLDGEFENLTRTYRGDVKTEGPNLTQAFRYRQNAYSTLHQVPR